MLTVPSPGSQWGDIRIAATLALRLAPILDASGVWVLVENVYPNGSFVDDPGGSGFTFIDDTLIVGLRPTLLPSGVVVIY